MSIDREKYLSLTKNIYYKSLGKVSKVVGLTIESIGPEARLNDLCMIYTNERDRQIMAEVVGFKDKSLLLMPFESMEGVGVGCIVENTMKPLSVKVGDDLLEIGRAHV